MKKFVFTILATVCVAASAWAAEPKWKSMEPFALVPVQGTNAGEIYQPGDFGIVFNYLYQEADQLYKGNDEISNSGPVDTKKIDVHVLKLRYGISENLDVRMAIPFFDIDVENAAGDSLATPHGIGDTGLVFRYQFLNQRKGAPVCLAAGLGGELPTGKTDSDGLGTGAWSPYGEVGLTYVWARQRIDTELNYYLRMEGDDDYEQGDRLDYNLHYAYALNHYLDVGFEMNGRWTGKDQTDGVKNANTGGNEIFIGPEVHLKWLAKKAFLSFFIPFSVYQDVNGQQLKEDWRFQSKFGIKF